MNDQTVIATSPTIEILNLLDTQVSDYVAAKRRNHQLGGIIGKLNHELMFGTSNKRKNAGAALEKLGYVLD